MNKQCRGFACIINVFRSVGFSDRNGTYVDCERLKELFKQLHFDVKVFNDGDGLSAKVSLFALLLGHVSVYTTVHLQCFLQHITEKKCWYKNVSQKKQISYWEIFWHCLMHLRFDGIFKFTAECFGERILTIWTRISYLLFILVVQ